MKRFLMFVCMWVGAGLVCAPSANATFHLWGINEVYSDATGTVQFVEMFTDSGFEQFLSGQRFTSLTNTLIFDRNLVGSTGGRHLLMATPAYAALPGVPAPDFIFPTNNFFNINGDTLTLVGGSGNFGGQPAQLTFTAGQLPTDGLRSLSFDLTLNATNSPTNFAGQSGVVPEPVILAGWLVGAVVAVRPRRRPTSRMHRGRCALA